MAGWCVKFKLGNTDEFSEGTGAVRGAEAPRGEHEHQEGRGAHPDSAADSWYVAQSGSLTVAAQVNERPSKLPLKMNRSSVPSHSNVWRLAHEDDPLAGPEGRGHEANDIDA